MALNRRDLLLAALSGPAFGLGRAAHGGTGVGLSQEAVRDLLMPQIDPGRESPGYVAVVIDGDGARLVPAGVSDAPDGRPLDGDSIFEIGSITKVFSAVLLFDMVQRGEVSLADPVALYLPPEGRPRTFDGKPISLLDLVTHTSGLPRMPDNFRPMDQANPYADYSISQLYEFVSSFVPQYYPGSHYEYSNLGFGLLGHALALRAGRSYEDLVVERVCEKLGLANTRITLTPEMRARLVPGHDTGLRRVSNWDLPTLAGAGALRSCAHDLVRFLDAAQGRVETSLTPAFGRLLEVRRQTDSANVVAAAGWFVTAEHSDELVWKDGGTGGYATFVGYSARSGVAAVLLSNSRSYYSATALGRHLVNPGFPAPVLHHPVTVDAATLARLAGRYPVLPSLTLTVFSRDGGLFVAQPGQGETEVFAESETRFFYREVNAQLTFEIGADGKATALVLHQNGRDRRAVRTP
jgi:CubicO group peptidase (beta-lactamase class C family)